MRLFLLGLVTFLMGHLFFIRWLDRMQPPAVADMVFPVIAVIGIFAVTGMGSFHTGRLRPCILVYTFFNCIPVCKKCMHIAVSIPDMRHIVCAVGSFLFMISDISILFLYFYKNKSRKVHLFNLTTYYVGIFASGSQSTALPIGQILCRKMLYHV